MRVRNKDWWTLYFTDDDWKESFRMTRQPLYILDRHFVQQQQLVPRVLRHYAISTSVHYKVQYFPVSVFNPIKFTCPLDRIRKGLNHSL